MKKKLGLLLALLLAACVLTAGVGQAKAAKDKDEPAAQAPPTPPPGVYVADYANVVSEEDREVMAALGRELQRKCGVLVICLTEDALEGAPLGMYAEMVRTSWGLGEKDSLILFIRQGRRLHFANGRELADRLTKEQLDKVVAPIAEPMQKRQFSPALTQLYHNLVLALAGAYVPEEVPQSVAEQPAEELPVEEAAEADEE